MRRNSGESPARPVPAPALRISPSTSSRLTPASTRFVGLAALPLVLVHYVGDEPGVVADGKLTPNAAA